MNNSLLWMRRKVGGVSFPYPVMVGGGIVKTWEHVRALAPTDVVAEWGSIETEPSSGNGGRDYYAHYLEGGDHRYLLFTMNSLGIPNPGMAYVEQHAPDLIKLYEDHDKPLVINVSGRGVEDAVELVKRAVTCNFKVVVLNGACPNKRGQPILCYDFDAVSELFERIESEVGVTDTVLLWKISAGMPRPILVHNRDCVARSKVFTGMVTCNTVPSTFYLLDDGRTAIKTDKNKIDRGGMGGPAILPIVLDHAEFCASGMPEGKVVFGVGGITTTSDAMRFFKAGAVIVQMVSAWREAYEDPDFIRDFIDTLRIRLHPGES